MVNSEGGDGAQVFNWIEAAVEGNCPNRVIKKKLKGGGGSVVARGACADVEWCRRSSRGEKTEELSTKKAANARTSRKIRSYLEERKEEDRETRRKQ